MISTTQSPKTKTQLVQQIGKLPSNSKFETVEVFSMKDKPTLNKTLTTLLGKVTSLSYSSKVVSDD